MASRQPDGYDTLRRVPIPELEAWIDQTCPAGELGHWWISVFDSLESEVLMLLRSEESVVRTLQFVVNLLGIAERRKHGKVFAAYWTLRFAGLASRYEALAVQVPETLTPNESVRRALLAIPLTQQAAVAIGRRRSAELAGDVERSADPDIQALQDVETLIVAAKWVGHRVSDAALAGRLAEWLDVYEQIAPTVDATDS